MTDSIIDKIKKLNAKAESAQAIGNEDEARAFAEGVNRLLAQHKLSRTEIDWDVVHKREQVEGRTLDWQSHGMQRKRIRVAWSERLCAIVARAYSCQIMVHVGSNNFTIVGRKSDREIAEFVMVTLCRSAEKIADQEYVRFFYECRERGEVEEARGFRQAFLDGFIGRMAERFEELRRQMEQGSSMALMRIKKEVEDVKNYVKEHGAKCHAVRGRRQDNAEGRARGRAKADGMRIDGRDVVEGQPGGRMLP